MATTSLRTAHRGAQRTLAVVLPFLVAAALAAARGGPTTATSVLVLVLVVVGIGATGDRLAGLLAAVSCGLWFDVFLTEPTGQLTIKDPDDVEVAVLLVVVGIAVTEIALWGLRQQARAARGAGFLDGVLESADVVAGSDVDVDDAHRRVAARIEGVLGLDRCRRERRAELAPAHQAQQMLELRQRDGAQPGMLHGRSGKNASSAWWPMVGTTSARSRYRLKRSHEHSATNRQP